MGGESDVGPEAGGRIGEFGFALGNQLQSDPEIGARLLEAHAEGNLVDIAHHYARASDQAEEQGDVDRACFFLTHAWIFALEAGDPIADEHRSRLARYGRV